MLEGFRREREFMGKVRQCGVSLFIFFWFCNESIHRIYIYYLYHIIFVWLLVRGSISSIWWKQNQAFVISWLRRPQRINPPPGTSSYMLGWGSTSTIWSRWQKFKKLIVFVSWSCNLINTSSSQGTNLELHGIEKYNVFHKVPYSIYFVTAVAKDPAAGGSLVTFQTSFYEEVFGVKSLSCFIARPKPGPHGKKKTCQFCYIIFP